MEYMKLEDRLSKFKGAANESELQKMFKELAPAFLYGGYIQVRKEFQVFIRTVEFYFHSEKEYGIHDPIVYHRNGRDIDYLPYFPLMTLNAHASGFDITFENETFEYRASALIRSYEVKNKEGLFLKWEKNKDGKYMFALSPDYAFNTQSTYLYTLLNGFSLGKDNGIYWVDSPRKQSVAITEKTRQNVFKSESEFEYIKSNAQCERRWSFNREEIV